METIIAIIATPIVSVIFLGFIAWRERENRKQVSELTSKIMSKNYVEFASYRKDELKAEQPQPVPVVKKQFVDSQMGKHF